MVPKLSDRYVTLPPFAALSWLAAQVLWNSVAAGVATVALLPEDANETVLLIDRFDKLFNAFNSGNLTSENPMGHGMTEI